MNAGNDKNNFPDLVARFITSNASDKEIQFLKEELKIDTEQ